LLNISSFATDLLPGLQILEVTGRAELLSASAIEQGQFGSPAVMALAETLVVCQVGLTALLADTPTFPFAPLVAQLASPSLASSAIFLEILLNREGRFVALDAVAETFNNQLLMLDAYYLLAGFAPVLLRFVLDSIVVDDALRTAFGADDVVGRVVLIAHRFQVLEDGGGRHKGYIDLRAYHAFEAVAAIVPI
jgi:hypothetical protein